MCVCVWGGGASFVSTSLNIIAERDGTWWPAIPDETRRIFYLFYVKCFSHKGKYDFVVLTRCSALVRFMFGLNVCCI